MSIFLPNLKHMINTKSQTENLKEKFISLFNSDLFSFRVIRVRPIVLIFMVSLFVAAFVIAVLNPEHMFSLFTGLGFFLAGFIISNMFYLKASGKKADEYNRQIISNSSDLFLVFRIKDGRFKYASPSIKKTLGYDTTSVVNQYDLSFIHPADRFEFYNILDQNHLRLNRAFTITLRMIKRNGEICWINMKGDVKVDASNELEMVVLNLRDVTIEKEQFIAQEQYQKSLEQSIQKNTSKTHEYEEIADLMSSYDLKEPLRTISSYSQLIRHRYAENLDNDGKDFLQYTIDGADRMARMIDDISSFSNVRLEKFRLRNVNVEKAVKEVEHVLHHQLKSKDAKIHFSDLPEIKADFVQIKQLLKSLIENALKFSGDQKPIIRISAEDQENQWVFKIEDNGIGISKVYHKTIFDVFGKINNVKGSNGKGVGLAVCKKIVTNHNGEIWLESNGEGEGSKFYFSIPKNTEIFNTNNIPNNKNKFQQELTFKKLKLHI